MQPFQPPDPVRARALLDSFAAGPSLLNIRRAAAYLPSLRESLGRVSIRLGCVASFTFEPFQSALELQALRAGLCLDTYVGPFGQFEQELIDAASGLAAFKPDAVLLAVRLEDVCPVLYRGFAGLTRADADRLLDDWFERLQAALSTFRSHSSATLLIQNYDLPATPALGMADRKAAFSQAESIARANARLDELAGAFENVFVMDYDALVARHGRARWCDPRTALFARIPVASDHFWPLAGFYVCHLRPLYGLTKKALVLDADNTLWGGVVGDVGLNGIALGHDFPGNAFVAFQERILDLYHRGVVLALASKNEPDSVKDVLDNHQDMLLRAEHFAAMRIDWLPKPDNVRRIAEDLNLGLDSFVFIDDSPVECELMRTSLPDVLTVQLPSDPAAYPGVIESLDCFDQWHLSEEDRSRGRLYKAEADRKVVRAQAVDLPTFYRGLEMKMTLFVDHTAHVARAAQMTNRTNQFNMHTVRCSEDDIQRFMGDAAHEVITLALADRFGDNGVVGLAVLRHDRAEQTDRLHLLLMSCRVLGRTVEQAFIGWIADRARSNGAERIVAELKRTAKNTPFATFYGDNGFTAAGEDDGVELWERDLSDEQPPMPDWLTLKVMGDTP